MTGHHLKANEYIFCNFLLNYSYKREDNPMSRVHDKTVEAFTKNPRLIGSLLHAPKVKMSDKELRTELKDKRNAWEALTRRNQDIDDSFIQTAPIAEVKKRLEWYESDEAYISAAPWLIGLVKRFVNK